MAGIYRTQDATTERVYLHGDHLGSSSVVTNASGTVAKSYSFDPWGAPRNAATWVSDLSEWPGYQGDRGFTGHEMLASLELVHMNARIYDPALGRSHHSGRGRPAKLQPLQLCPQQPPQVYRPEWSYLR